MARRWNRVQSQILVWAGEEPLEIMYDAETFRIPSRNEHAQVGEGRPYRHESARTRSGAYIPGTIVILDAFRDVEGGGRVKTFDVASLCTYLEEQRGDLFNRGLEIVSDPDEVAEVMKELIPKWEASQDARAHEIVRAELQRRKRLEEKGEPLTPGSSEKDVVWAFAHLKHRQANLTPAVSTEDLFAAAGGLYTKSAAPKGAAAPTESGTLFQQAEELGIALNKGEMAGLLKGDAMTADFVRKKIAARREELAAAQGA